MNETLTAIEAAIKSGIDRALAEAGSEESKVEFRCDSSGDPRRDIFGYEIFYGYSDENALLFWVSEEITASNRAKSLGEGTNHRFHMWQESPGVLSEGFPYEIEIADEAGFDYANYCYTEAKEFLEEEAKFYGPYSEEEDEESE